VRRVLLRLLVPKDSIKMGEKNPGAKCLSKQALILIEAGAGNTEKKGQEFVRKDLESGGRFCGLGEQAWQRKKYME